MLLAVIKACFAKLKQLRLPPKALVFVDNLTTLELLAGRLTEDGNNVLTNNTPDYAECFRDTEAAVLIATDTAAKGLDMEFCPLVVNYDMLYNAVEMEQRISRCHRQGQKSDVVVVNLLSDANFSDVRILELINKRTLQFNGIFGMSDDIVGNFHNTIDEVLAQIRKPDDIVKAFETNLAAHEDENRRLVSHVEDTLFTTFTKAIADKVTITPQYTEDKSAAINADLWELTQQFFARRDDYEIDEYAQTITLKGNEAPQLFYYWTGSRNKPYTGLKKYGMGQGFKPNSGRVTLTSVITKGIISETACANSGAVTVVDDIPPCEIGFYAVSVISNRTEVASYDVLVGLTETGVTLSHEQCKEILEIPVSSYISDGEPTSNWLKNATGNTRFHPVDNLVPSKKFIQRYFEESGSAQAEEIERIKLRAMRKKTLLEHSLDDIRLQIKSVKQELATEVGDRLKELKIGKRLKLLDKELRGKEQRLFFDQLRIDTTAEEEIAAITARGKYETQVTRQFIIKVVGGQADG